MGNTIQPLFMQANIRSLTREEHAQLFLHGTIVLTDGTVIPSQRAYNLVTEMMKAEPGTCEELIDMVVGEERPSKRGLAGALEKSSDPEALKALMDAVGYDGYVVPYNQVTIDFIQNCPLVQRGGHVTLDFQHIIAQWKEKARNTLDGNVDVLKGTIMVMPPLPDAYEAYTQPPEMPKGPVVDKDDVLKHEIEGVSPVLARGWVEAGVHPDQVGRFAKDYVYAGANRTERPKQADYAKPVIHWMPGKP